MIARPQKADRAAGFALVDLLVAMAVAALTASVLIGLLRFVEYSRAEATRREREHEGALVLERVLRLLVERAPPAIPGSSPESSVVGDEHELSVISNGPSSLGLPQVSVFHLRREVGLAGSDAVLSWVDDTGQSYRRVLAQGVTKLTFAYLPLAPDRLDSKVTQEKTWRSRWNADDGPLSALRLVLLFERDSASWIFVIPIAADLPAICLRNPQQTGCAPRGLG